MKLDVETIRNQAKKMKKEMPELFEYLAERDKATTEMVTALYQSKPIPDQDPKMEIPFIGVVVELFAPQDSCPVCDDDSLFLLGEKVRMALCDACKNGIYVRGTGVASLASG